MNAIAIPWRVRWQQQRDQEAVDAIRRERLVEINTNRAERTALEARHGQVWDTDELSRDFTVEGFMAPFVVVRRKSDGAVGSLEFQAQPRFYFNFVVDQR